jgi:hypothetical protein
VRGRWPWLAGLFAALAVVLALACGGSTITDQAPCAPGRSLACVATNGCSGVQMCKADGSGYEACVCFADGGGGGGVGSREAGVEASVSDSAPDSLPDALSSDASSSSDRPDSQGMDAGAATDAGPTNLITAGNFPQGTTLWAITSGPGTLAVDGGSGCVTLNGGGEVASTLGWPAPVGTPGLQLSPSASYTFSYSAEANSLVTIEAKVGQTTTPYVALFDTKTDIVGTSLSSFTHPFTTPSSASEDMSIGLAFVLPQVTNVVCFENVSLVQNTSDAAP